MIDPLASNQLGYWRWAERGAYFGVPLKNFAGWFVVSLAAFAVLRKKFEAGQTASLTGLSIILFFTLLALALGDLLVALSGSRALPRSLTRLARGALEVRRVRADSVSGRDRRLLTAKLFEQSV